MLTVVKQQEKLSLAKCAHSWTLSLFLSLLIDGWQRCAGLCSFEIWKALKEETKKTHVGLGYSSMVKPGRQEPGHLLQ